MLASVRRRGSLGGRWEGVGFTLPGRDRGGASLGSGSPGLPLWPFPVGPLGGLLDLSVPQFPHQVDSQGRIK